MASTLQDLDRYICRDGDDGPSCNTLVAALEQHARATESLAMALREACELLRGGKLNYGKCEVCGAAFELLRSDAKYCSNACKTKAYRIRRTKEETT